MTNDDRTDLRLHAVEVAGSDLWRLVRSLQTVLVLALITLAALSPVALVTDGRLDEEDARIGLTRLLSALLDYRDPGRGEQVLTVLTVSTVVLLVLLVLLTVAAGGILGRPWNRGVTALVRVVGGLTIAVVAVLGWGVVSYDDLSPQLGLVFGALAAAALLAGSGSE